MNSSSSYFWTANEIGSQPYWGKRIGEREIDSRQQIDVTHSGKKSYFDLDNNPMPVMILKRARRLPQFSVHFDGLRQRVAFFPVAGSEPSSQPVKG